MSSTLGEGGGRIHLMWKTTAGCTRKVGPVGTWSIRQNGLRTEWGKGSHVGEKGQGMTYGSEKIPRATGKGKDKGGDSVPPRPVSLESLENSPHRQHIYAGPAGAEEGGEGRARPLASPLFRSWCRHCVRSRRQGRLHKRAAQEMGRIPRDRRPARRASVCMRLPWTWVGP